MKICMCRKAQAVDNSICDNVNVLFTGSGVGILMAWTHKRNCFHTSWFKNVLYHFVNYWAFPSTWTIPVDSRTSHCGINCHWWIERFHYSHIMLGAHPVKMTIEKRSAFCVLDKVAMRRSRCLLPSIAPFFLVLLWRKWNAWN